MFLGKETAKKKFQSVDGSWLFFISPGQWIRNEQILKVGLNNLLFRFLTNLTKSIPTS